MLNGCYGNEWLPWWSWIVSMATTCQWTDRLTCTAAIIRLSICLRLIYFFELKKRKRRNISLVKTMCGLYRIWQALGLDVRKKKKRKILQFQSPQFGLFHHHYRIHYFILWCHTPKCKNNKKLSSEFDYVFYYMSIYSKIKHINEKKRGINI